MKPLTMRQSDILAIIQQYIEANGHAPSYRRLAQLAGVLHDGPSQIDNLQTLCRTCNTRKRQQLIDFRN